MEPIDDRKTLRGARILLLEDDALISIDAEDMLRAIGAGEVFVAHTLETGCRLAARQRLDAAVLDVMIGHKTCDGVARQLMARGIPFVFASGCGDRSILAEDMWHLPHVLKPYSARVLAEAFEALGLSPHHNDDPPHDR